MIIWGSFSDGQLCLCLSEMKNISCYLIWIAIRKRRWNKMWASSNRDKFKSRWLYRRNLPAQLQWVTNLPDYRRVGPGFESRSGTRGLIAEQKWWGKERALLYNSAIPVGIYNNTNTHKTLTNKQQNSIMYLMEQNLDCSFCIHLQIT
jgi:hypothetical protein